MITFDREIATQRCDACNVDYTVVRGSIFDRGHPFGLYLATCHGHSTPGRVAYLAIGVLDRREPEAAPVAVALEVSAWSGELRQSVVEWAECPWVGAGYLGRRLDREDALAHVLRPVVSQLAGHLLSELAELKAYLEAGDVAAEVGSGSMPK